MKQKQSSRDFHLYMHLLGLQENMSNEVENIINRNQKGGGKQNQWFEEKWIQIVPFLTSGKRIDCGSPNKETKACRPTKKINQSTPPTMQEIVKKYGKEKVLELARKKNRDMKGRLSWVKGTFTPSKDRK